MPSNLTTLTRTTPAPSLAEETNSTALCVLCRFDFGFTVMGLDPGLLGLLLACLALVCCFSSSLCSLYCLCCWRRAGYAPVAQAQAEGS